MTSNIGAEYLLNGITPDGEISEDAKEEVMEELKDSFRPEFLNRLDETIFFKPLTENDIKSIARIQIEALNERLADRELKLSVSEEALSFIAHNGYEPVYGARPLKRYIQKNVETAVAKLILSDTLEAGDMIEISLEGDTLCCHKIQ